MSGKLKQEYDIMEKYMNIPEKEMFLEKEIKMEYGKYCDVKSISRRYNIPVRDVWKIVVKS